MIEGFREHVRIFGVPFEKVTEAALAQVPLKRFLQPKEVPDLAVYLGSGQSLLQRPRSFQAQQAGQCQQTGQHLRVCRRLGKRRRGQPGAQIDVLVSIAINPGLADPARTAPANRRSNTR